MRVGFKSSEDLYEIIDHDFLSPDSENLVDLLELC